MDDGMAAPARLIRDVPTGGIASLPAARRRRPIVIVLGMDGSGTALCSRALSALGVEMRDTAPRPGSEPAKRNGAAEHRERPEIARFHSRILDLFERSRDHPSPNYALPVAWWSDPRVADIRREIATFVEERLGIGLFGFTDPRTVQLLPVWHQITKELKLTPKIIYCLGNPAQVARSLRARDGISLEMGEYRWFAHTLDVFRYTEKTGICTIEYDSWFDDYTPNLQKLRTFLEIATDQPELDADPPISAILGVEEIEKDPGVGEARQPLIRSVYKLARRAERDPAACEQLRSIATQFVSFQQLQAGAQGSPDDAAAMGGAAGLEVPAFRYCISPASFWSPEHVLPSAWYQHAPFAFWITEALRPGTFVELGTHHGFSYLVFCQAVQRLGSTTKCYAIDTWKGDTHAGFYGDEVLAKLSDIHERQYSGFSRLIRSTFDEALPHFGDGTIDLLHIDGRHGYEDVAHDFESWLPKLSDRAVVLFHDINVRERQFGVWQLWRDLQDRYRCFEFTHGHGLGIVQVGSIVREGLRPLFESTPEDKAAIAEMYAQLGRQAIVPRELERQTAANAELVVQRSALEAAAEGMRAEITKLGEELAVAQVREQELERIRKQVAGLRDAVLRAEREAEERSAAAAAMRIDIDDTLKAARHEADTLKSELAYAHHAGRAAIQALAASSAGAVYRVPRLGWRQTLRLLLGFTGNP
jgi:hypothetical protein